MKYFIYKSRGCCEIDNDEKYEFIKLLFNNNNDKIKTKSLIIFLT